MKKEKNKQPKSAVFTMRITPESKEKLESLAANKAFKFNKSAVVTRLIEAEHFKTIKP